MILKQYYFCFNLLSIWDMLIVFCVAIPEKEVQYQYSGQLFFLSTEA